MNGNDSAFSLKYSKIASYQNRFSSDCSSLPPSNVVCEGCAFTGVCLSTGGGLPQCMLGCSPQTRHTHPRSRPPHQAPPGADTPPEQTHPGSRPPRSRHPRTDPPRRSRHPPGADPPEQSMLGDTVNERAVRILLECNLVVNKM